MLPLQLSITGLYSYQKKQFINFEKAEEDLEPICLLEKDWEIMKLDFNEFILK